MSRKIRGTLFVIFGCICWGASGTCGEFLFNEKAFSPLLLTAIRMVFAGLMLITISLFKEREKLKQLFKEPVDLMKIAIFGLAGIAFSQVSYLFAIKYTNAGIATALQCTSPVMIMLFVCLTTHKLPKHNEAIAVVVAVLGAFVISMGFNFTFSMHPLGLFWGLMGGFAVLIYTVMPQKMLAKWGSILVSGAGMFSGGIIFSLLIGFWNIPVNYDLPTLGAVATMVVLGTVIAYTAYLQGVDDVGPVIASILSTVEPLSATVFSVVFLKTALSADEITGILLIISTVFILALSDRKIMKNRL